MTITYCERHADTETSLSCGRCRISVCPKCMRHAPVGIRCPDCAKVRPVPTYNVSGVFLARAVGVGVATAGLGGVVASVLIFLLAIPILWWIIIVGLGYVVGEGISVATNRKRGRTLKIVAAGAMFVALTIITLTTGVTIDIFGLFASGISVYIAVNKL